MRSVSYTHLFNEVKGIKPESDGSTPDGIEEAAAQEQPESIEQHEDLSLIHIYS